MCLFFALDPPEALRAALAAFQVRNRFLKASWTDPSKLHLTLAFMGEVPAERLSVLRHIGETVARRHPSLPLCSATLGAFPRTGKARVLWLGLDPNPALELLAVELRRELAAVGFLLDGKPFAAHLTLARFRVPVDLAPLGLPPAPFPFTSVELVLYRSHLLAKGARYERLQGFPLEG